jgi:hypothetical protein
MKRLMIFLFAAACAAACAAPATAAQDISWGYAVQKWVKTSYEPQTPGKPVRLQPGEDYQIIIKAKTAAHLYLISRKPDGSIAPLAKLMLLANVPLYLPSRSGTFPSAGAAGAEKIIIIVSDVPQTKLEAVLDGVQKGSSDARSVTEEISRIRQSVGTLADVPGKPSPMGGVTRGAAKKLEMNEFSGNNLYVKTLIIQR